MNKSIKFEDLMNELDEVVKALESNDLSLEESIEQYKRGIELSNQCKKLLEEAKDQIVKKME